MAASAASIAAFLASSCACLHFCQIITAADITAIKAPTAICAVVAEIPTAFNAAFIL